MFVWKKKNYFRYHTHVSSFAFAFLLIKIYIFLISIYAFLDDFALFIAKK